MRLGNLGILLLLVLACTACLIQDTTHTLYLEPDGRVAWMILQRDVRSDAESPRERLDEEDAFLDGVRRGDHDLARGLEALGGYPVESELLRPRRPYLVRTEAGFRSIDRLGQALVDRVGLDGHVELRYEGTTTVLSIRIRPGDVDEQALEDDPVVALLLESPDDYRIVLTEGRFVRATGFRLDDKGTEAVPEEWHGDAESGDTIEYELAWTR